VGVFQAWTYFKMPDGRAPSGSPCHGAIPLPSIQCGYI